MSDASRAAVYFAICCRMASVAALLSSPLSLHAAHSSVRAIAKCKRKAREPAADALFGFLIVSSSNRHPHLHMLRADIFDVVADVPLDAERVQYRSRSLAVKLVLRLTHHFGAKSLRPSDEIVGVIDVNVDLKRTRLGRIRGDDRVFRKLIRKHHACGSKFDLGMPDAAIRFGQPELLLRAEHLFIKLDGFGCVFHTYIRKQFFYFHASSFRLTMPFCGFHVLNEIDLEQAQIRARLVEEILVTLSRSDGEGPSPSPSLPQLLAKQGKAVLKGTHRRKP